MALNAATPSAAANLKVTHLLVNLPFMWMHNKARHIIQQGESSRARERGGVGKISRHLSAPVCQFIFRDVKYFHIATTGGSSCFLKDRPFLGERADERFLLCLISYLRLQARKYGPSRVVGVAGGLWGGHTALALILSLFQKYHFNPRPHRVTHVRHLHGRNWT